MNYLTVGLLSLLAFWILKTLAALRRNVAIAKSTGIRYHISPIGGMMAPWYPAVEHSLVGLCSSIPYVKDSRLPIYLTCHRGWKYHQRMREQLGEIFMIVSPWSLYLNCNRPEEIVQLLTRRQGFLKPLELYGIIDIFGSSIISTEGETWRRHRKIVGPAFAEKSNILVWQDSLHQVRGMLNLWSRVEGNTKDSMRIEDVGIDTAHLALNVISGAGFGVKQLWHGENEDQLGDSVVPGFNTEKLTNGHTFTFQNALQELISGVILKMIVPEWFMKHLPFDLLNRVQRAHGECANYFAELIEYKTELLEAGNDVDKRTMDIMAPLVKASQNSPDDPRGLYLTKKEVIADSWLLLFAGHETTANTLHYTLIFLALAPNTQSQLQKQVDAIVGSRPQPSWTYEKDMGRLFNSLVGASFMETLRLMPPVLELPKVCRGSGPQMLRVDGKDRLIPLETFIHADSSAVQRNPRYWPHSASIRTGAEHDMNDFVPQRWTSAKSMAKAAAATKYVEAETTDDLEKGSFESSGVGSLFTPARGVYLPFAEGNRSCPGKRFAQVEMTAVLASIYQEYSVELDVGKWASDAEVDKMNKSERKALYEKAILTTRKIIDGSVVEIALKMLTVVPLRIVKRGDEKFMDCYL